MSFSQKFFLTFLGLLALITVSFSIIYIVTSFRGVKQTANELDCTLYKPNECNHNGNFTQTESTTPNAPLIVTPSPTQPVFVSDLITPTNIILTVTPTFSVNTTQTSSPVTPPSFEVSANDLPAAEWRKFPIVPYLSDHSKQILLKAMENGFLDRHTFVKVGDCHMESDIFLSGFVHGSYHIPTGLENTVQWFSESMVTDNITAINGYGINTILDPTYALPKGNEHCFVNETPLSCELRTKRPMIVLIAMGTNWVPHGEDSFEKYLRIAVLQVLETGALPILATKADNIEGDWKINLAIAQVAIDYDIPLVNIWGAMQNLPHKGLQDDGIHLTGDGWLRNSSTWLKALEVVYQTVSQSQ